MMKNIRPSNMQKSMRASCITPQNPTFYSIGIFVVTIATEISTPRALGNRNFWMPSDINTHPTTAEGGLELLQPRNLRFADNAVRRSGKYVLRMPLFVRCQL